LSLDTNKIFLRPRFSIDLNKSKEEVLGLFQQEKKEDPKRFSIRIVDEHIFLDILQKDNHFWSPHLHLELLDEDDGKTQLKGLFGPKPQVWTFFMFLHFVVATAFIGCAIWAYVGSKLEEASIFPIVMVVILPIIWILLYLFGRLGKDFGRSQIVKMQGFLIELLEIKPT
jgi:hypothetical protein